MYLWCWGCAGNQCWHGRTFRGLCLRIWQSVGTRGAVPSQHLRACNVRRTSYVFFLCIVSLLCRSCTFNCWWLAALRAGVYALCAFACLWVDPPYVFISRWWLLWYPGRTFTQHVFFFYSFCGWFSFLFSWGFLWRCVLRFSVKPVWFRCFPPFLHLLHFFLRLFKFTSFGFLGL